MTTLVLHHDSDDPESTFLRDNSHKKTYAKVIQENAMHDSSFRVGDGDMEDLSNHERGTEQQIQLDDTQPGAEDGQTDETWEIRITPELKTQLVGPWKMSIILKLMGQPLRYRALQSKLAGIWRPTSMMHLIDIGYGFFIMRFDVLKDYHHALMDGPWFVGDQYLHVQAWEADFHPHIAKISNMAVWIYLEQLPIEYYHPEFLKHISHKLGKLLKVDAFTSAAIRGRYARVCVQINMVNPLPKRVKIGTFWQDIVYENLPMLCYRCGRLSHREPQCSEGMAKPTTMPPQEPDPRILAASLLETTHVLTPWKTVQTRRTRARGRTTKQPPHGKNVFVDSYSPGHPRDQASSSHAHGQRTH